MVWIGIVMTLAGFALSVLSLGIASSVNARLVIVLLSIAISFAGIIGLINPAFVKKAIWRAGQ